MIAKACDSQSSQLFSLRNYFPFYGIPYSSVPAVLHLLKRSVNEGTIEVTGAHVNYHVGYDRKCVVNTNFMAQRLHRQALGTYNDR